MLTWLKVWWLWLWFGCPHEWWHDDRSFFLVCRKCGNTHREIHRNPNVLSHWPASYYDTSPSPADQPHGPV
jgi:hypothetical protein